jgi:dynein light chain LC8-type
VYHAVVGKHFGASFSHETNSYVHLKVDLNNVVVFKSKDSPFDIDQP